MTIRNFNNIKSLFFDNITIKQTIFKNTFWLMVASGVSRVLSFFLFIYIARILGATEYGVFTFALSFVCLLSIFSDFGISGIATRELSRNKQGGNEYQSLLSLKLLLIAGTMTLVFLGSFLITQDQAIRKIIWILTTYICIGSFTQIVYAFLEARQKMEYKAWANILQAILFTAFGFFVILTFPSAENLGYSYLAGTLVFLSILLFWFQRKVHRLHFSWNKAIWKRFLTMSWPLALAGIFATIYTQIDSVMMGFLNQITETGWYNAALRITKVTFLPAILISQSAYPALSIAFKESKEKLQRIWDSLIEVMIFLAVPMVTGGLILAPKIILFIYDSGFVPAILAFQILIFMSGLIFLSNPLSTVLVAGNQEKKIFWVSLAGIIINVSLNAFLIPRYSLYGAAFATVITYSTMFLLLSHFTFRHTSLKLFNQRIFFSLIIAGLSTILMYGAITQPLLRHFHVLSLVLIGAVIYFSILFGLRRFLKIWNIL